MAVQFLIGRAGTGKTHHCLDAITAACAQDPLGPPIIYLVPEQASYQSEKALLTFGRVDGLTRAQVLSFTRLADYVFARGAAPRLPRLTQAHRRVLVMLLVSQARRDDPDGLAGAQGIEDALLDFLAETRQQAVEPHDLEAAARALLSPRTGEPPLTARLLAEKLQRLQSLLERYLDFSRQRFQDPQETLLQVSEQILRSPSLQGARLYVDGFTGFTPVEEKLLVALGKRATSVSINLLGDPARAALILKGTKLRRHPVFQTVEDTLADLLRLFHENNVPIEAPRFLEEEGQKRFLNDGVCAVEKHFFARRPEGPVESDTVSFFVSRTSSEEAREAAELAAEWMREHGWRPEEIGILTRDLEEYAPPLAQALETLRIPHFIDRAQPLAAHPYVTGLLSLARAALSPGRHLARHLIDFGKSGLAPIPRRRIDALEYEVTQHPRKPADWFSAEPWMPPPPRSPMDDDHEVREADSFNADVDATRRALVGEVSNFRASIHSGDTKQGALAEFLHACAVHLARLAAARTISDLDRRILHRILETLAIAHETAGKETVLWDVAMELLQRLFGDLTLPRIPPMAGELFVGQVDRSRFPGLRGVIILGVAEGRFPRIITSHSLVNDGERDMLEGTGLRLRPSGRKQYEREALDAYRGLTAASERIALFRPNESRSGDVLAASAFWEDLRGVFTKLQVKQFPPADHPSRAWRHRELAASVFRLVSSTHTNSHADAAPALAILAERPVTPDSNRVTVEALWRNRATVQPELFIKALGNPARMSASQLEAFARCPYQHFARYLLRPAEALMPRFERRDAGNYFHAVLRNFTKLLRERGLSGATLPDEQLKELLMVARREPEERLQRTGLLDGAAGTYLFNRMNNLLIDMVGWVSQAISSLPYRPAAEEISFGPKAILPEITLETRDGHTVLVRGQIDRLDLAESPSEDGALGAVVVDYKLHRKTFSFQQWESGESLQLPIYLLALRGGAWGGAPLQPRGALYAGIVSKTLEEERYAARTYDGIVNYTSLATLYPGDSVWRMFPMARADTDPAKSPTRYGPHLLDIEFDAVLDRTEEMLRAMAGEILSGVIDVAPSRHGTRTACAFCDAQEICGIDYRVNRARPRVDRDRKLILADLRGVEETS